MPAPTPRPALSPWPKYQTLMHNESAFRAVKTRFVDTAETFCVNKSINTVKQDCEIGAYRVQKVGAGDARRL